MKFSPHGSPITLVIAGKFYPEIPTPSERAKDGGKQDIKRQYLENDRRYVRSYN